jgi:hypothetical protein
LPVVPAIFVKGTRISGIDPESDTEVRLFHPRQDEWDEHFQVDSDSGTLVALNHLLYNVPLCRAGIHRFTSTASTSTISNFIGSSRITNSPISSLKISSKVVSATARYNSRSGSICSRVDEQMLVLLRQIQQ